MKTFEIDVSGSDIFDKNYTILVAAADNNEIMLGYKFTDGNREIINGLCFLE